MLLLRILLTVALCLFAGAAVGGGGGWFIGTHFPDAYATAPGRNPVHVGVGLGIPQGAALGGLLGVGIAAIMAWHDVRTRPPLPPEYPPE